jgi:hypothetical protein
LSMSIDENIKAVKPPGDLSTSEAWNPFERK